MSSTNSKSVTKNLYSKNAKEYDRHRLQKLRGRVLSEHDIALFLTMLPVDLFKKNILEVGAGTGRFTFPLLDTDSRMKILSTDINDEMLSRFRKRVLTEELKGQSRNQIEDVFNLSFKDNEFDFVFGIHLIPRFIKFEDQYEALNEISRVVKPGGHILFNFRNSNSPYRIFYKGYSITSQKINSMLFDFKLNAIKTKGKWLITRKLLDLLPESFSKIISLLDKALWRVLPLGAWDVFILAEKIGPGQNDLEGSEK